MEFVLMGKGYGDMGKGLWSCGGLWGRGEGTDLHGHGVERQAHGAGEGDALVVVLPRRQNEQPAPGTGFKVLVAWLGERVEAPWREENDGEPGIERCPHDGLLALGNGGRDEHCAGTRLLQEKSLLPFYVRFRQSA